MRVVGYFTDPVSGIRFQIKMWNRKEHRAFMMKTFGMILKDAEKEVKREQQGRTYCDEVLYLPQ